MNRYELRKWINKPVLDEVVERYETQAELRDSIKEYLMVLSEDEIKEHLVIEDLMKGKKLSLDECLSHYKKFSYSKGALYCRICLDLNKMGRFEHDDFMFFDDRKSEWVTHEKFREYHPRLADFEFNNWQQLKDWFLKVADLEEAKINIDGVTVSITK